MKTTIYQKTCVLLLQVRGVRQNAAGLKNTLIKPYLTQQAQEAH